MRFFRFRDRDAARAARPESEDRDSDAGERLTDDDESSTGEDPDVQAPAEGDGDDDAHWRRRAAAAIVGGASTGSKRPEALYGDSAPALPTHFVRAAGCELTTTGGQTLIDCTMALGAVALGYADPHVTGRVVDAAAAGNVAGLSHVLEVEVAERLCDVIPCAEAVRFLKTGAEAVAAAV